MKHVKGSTQAYVYQILRERILTLGLAPNQPLDETALSQEFNVSRSPIREALIRLAADGLVVSLVNKVTVVAPLDLDKLPSYLEALELFNRVVNRNAALFRSVDDIKEIVAAQAACDRASDRGDLFSVAEHNRNYHLRIAQATRNLYFRSFYGKLLEDGMRMMHLYLRYRIEKNALNLTEDHEQITRAIIDGDEREAEVLGRNHAKLFNSNFQNYLILQNAASKIVLEDA